MIVKEYRVNNNAFLYNSEIMQAFTPAIFQRGSKKEEGVCKQGRGEVSFFRHKGLDLVHRPYRRGGLCRYIIKESYLFLKLSRTRMWQEFNLLLHMHKLGLPVPVPVAVRCSRCTLFGYRGDLITRRIDHAATLVERLREGPLSSSTWYNIGRTIRTFHDRRINHADLNASNIMLDQNSTVFLIDFDKGRIETTGSSAWKEDNLARLQRSVNKLQGRYRDFHFEAQDWQNLLEGYQG